MESGLGKYIICYINPREVSITQGFRALEHLTRMGPVLVAKKDEVRKSIFDEMEVTFQFQTGNTIPSELTAEVKVGSEIEKKSSRLTTGPDVVAFPLGSIRHGGLKVSVPRGLRNLYAFLALLDEPRLLSDGRKNYVYISYSTPAFPSITLVGFFKFEPLTIQESTDSPFQITWQHTFTVVASSPERIGRVEELRKVFREAGFPQSSAGALAQKEEGGFSSALTSLLRP